MDQKFKMKEESSERILISIWDESIKNATVLLLFTVPICLILISIPLGLYLIRDNSKIPSELVSTLPIICLIVDGLIIIAIAYFQISSFRQASGPPSQSIMLDLKTGIANGVSKDFVTNKKAPWEFEINKVTSLKITWDDPRFDLANLEFHSSGSILHQLYGGRADMRQIGEKLKLWLKVPLEDQAHDYDPNVRLG